MSETNTTPKVETRDEIRAKIFNAKPRTIITEFFGTKVEVKGPTMGEILEDRNTDLDPKESYAHSLIRSVFVPGTDTKVFDLEDVPMLANLPAGPDSNALQQALMDMMGVDLDKHNKSLEEGSL